MTSQEAAMVESGTGIEVMSYLGKLNKGRFIWAGNGSKVQIAVMGTSWRGTFKHKMGTAQVALHVLGGPLAGHVRVSRRVMNG